LRTHYPAEFSPVLYIVVPGLSSLIFLVGLYLNVHSWPAAPMTSFPLIVLTVVIAA
jgi:hypothetical protein